MPARGKRFLAKVAGQRFYFTGISCPHGHVANRYTISGACVECGAVENHKPSSNIRKQAWAEQNRSSVRKSGLAWYKRNAVSENAKKRERYASDPAYKLFKIRERKRLVEYTRDYNKRYASANRDKVNAIRRNYEARKRAAVGTHNEHDVARLFVLQYGRCDYCYVSIDDGYHVDHVMPLIRGGSNGPENLCLACPSCNSSKQDMDAQQFRAYLSLKRAA